jgi:hypothetical protein
MGIPSPTTFPPGPTWVLVNYDNPISFPVWGQFDPKVREDRGKPMWDEKPGILGALPWLKYNGIGHHKITFEFYALATTILDFYPELAWFRLHELSLVDPSLGRPPVVLFTHGPLVYRGYITEVPEAPIKFWGGHDFLRSRKIQEIGPVKITITKLPDVPFQIDPFTNYVTYTEETVFEDLAKAQYGDARYAPSLAVYNQGIAVGETLELPRRSSGAVTKDQALAPYLEDAIEGL